MFEFRLFRPDESAFIEETNLHRSDAKMYSQSTTPPPDVTVTGVRVVYTSTGWGLEGHNAPREGSSEGATRPDDPPDPECTCTLSSMTEAQALDAMIDAEANKIREEILAKADQNTEYGSIIYVDSAGKIQHTPLQPPLAGYEANLDYNSLPKNQYGHPDYTRALAVVHSHPQKMGESILTDPDNPDKLLVPSNLDSSDDWDNFDGFIKNITDQGGNPADFSTYILGHNGTKMVLNEYHANDRSTSTSADGDLVPVDYNPAAHCDYHGSGG